MNIKDIAKLCGVSPSTVSKILHNKDENISIETRKKVLEIIKEYNYIPYSEVIKKAAPKTNLIGVILSMQDYGMADLLYELEMQAAQNNYSIIICNAENKREKTEKYIQVLVNKGVDGIICISQDREAIQISKVPVIHILSRKEKTGHVAEVYYEMQDAGYIAVKHLLDMGHQRIACLLYETDIEILKGYDLAYKEHVLQPLEEWKFCGAEADMIEFGISQCLSQNVTAVLCADIEIGNMLYEKLRDRGESIPHKVSVISARDGSLAERIYPKMSAINIPLAASGKAAVEELLHMIEGKKPAHECRRRLELHLVDRESTAAPAKRIRGKKIVVVGSMNMDCMINVSHIPTDGETVKTRNITQLPGGKGANQAVGAGKLDGQVYMVGSLGNDSEGKAIYKSLTGAGVKTDGIIFDDFLPTGKAYINVADGGESTIVIYPGANERLDCNHVHQFEYLLEDASYCLLTLEISERTVDYTVKQCKKRNVEVILKPSSVEKMKESLLEQIDYFIPNEKEVKLLVPEGKTIEEKAEILMNKGVKNVIVTLGHKGCYLKNKKYACFFPAADFQAVDNTGGADAFISAFAVALSEGNEILHAVSFATYAAGLSVTRQGVQPAMIERSGLDMYQEEIRDIYSKLK